MWKQDAYRRLAKLILSLLFTEIEEDLEISSSSKIVMSPIDEDGFTGTLLEVVGEFALQDVSTLEALSCVAVNEGAIHFPCVEEEFQILAY